MTKHKHTWIPIAGNTYRREYSKHGAFSKLLGLYVRVPILELVCTCGARKYVDKKDVKK